MWAHVPLATLIENIRTWLPVSPKKKSAVWVLALYSIPYW
jgi:hypothetical protein